MKKAIAISILVLLLAFVGLTAFAAEESPIFVKTVPISKIYNHRMGYRVVYMTNNFDFKVFYVPKEWFSVAGETGDVPKAELVVGNEATYPYFSIFWNKGAFSHVRIYARKNPSDSTWGDASSLGNIDDRFEVESLELEF